MASAISGPASLDGDRVDLHRLPDAAMSVGGTAGLAANSLPVTISACAASRREVLDQRRWPAPSWSDDVTTPAPETLAWAPAPSWSGHAGATGKSGSSSSARAPGSSGW